MGDRGRLVIPAAVREELGLRPGTRLSLRVEDGVLILMTPEAAERELLEMFKDVPISLAGELLEDRRLEVQHEGSQS
jgi:AbrB family looped-hinge helix DNA binding protein